MEMTFDEFVRVVCAIPDRLADPHFRSQHLFVRHRGDFIVDFLGRFETLHEDWHHVSKQVGFECSLPHKNRSDHRNYRDEYTPELAPLVAKRYEHDIEAFGYANEVSSLF